MGKKINFSLEQQMPTAQDYAAPVFTSNGAAGSYIPYSGEHSKHPNLFPEEIKFYAKNCVWNGRLINFKAKQIAGKGFIQLEEDEATKEMLANINDKEEDANEVLEKVGKDDALYGGFALLIVWSTDWKRWLSVEHVDFSKIRIGAVNEDGLITKYYYSFDWSKGMRMQEIPAFNWGKAKTNAKQFEKDPTTLNLEERTQLLYCQPYGFGEYYYPLPDYIAALSAIRGDINGDLYAEVALGNGISETTWINLVGTYTDEQFVEEAQTIIDNYAGAKNAGAPMITKSKTKEETPQISKAGTDSKESKFTAVSTSVMQKIVSAHSLTSPLLAGIALPGALGNRDEMIDAYELFYSNWTQREQMFVAKVFNKLLKINGMSPVKIDRLTIFDEQLNKPQS